MVIKYSDLLKLGFSIYLGKKMTPYIIRVFDTCYETLINIIAPNQAGQIHLQQKEDIEMKEENSPPSELESHTAKKPKMCKTASNLETIIKTNTSTKSNNVNTKISNSEPNLQKEQIVFSCYSNGMVKTINVNDYLEKQKLLKAYKKVNEIDLQIAMAEQAIIDQEIDNSDTADNTYSLFGQNPFCGGLYSIFSDATHSHDI